MRLLAIISLILLIGPNGVREANDGSRAYLAGDYERAADAYRSALEQLSADDRARRFAVLHNLGNSLFRMEQYDEARRFFEAASEAALTEPDRLQATYNAAGAELAAGRFSAAAELYREVLRDAPDHEDARFNYEYAMRRAQTENQESAGDESDEETGDGEGQNRDTGSELAEEQDESRGEDGQPDRGQNQGDAQQNDQTGSDDTFEADDARPDDSREHRMSRAQAEQILGALQQSEARLLREIQRAPNRDRTVEKDW
ncbi:MAG: tetratricopeptide repeat protein [Bacteroidota bacterium]